MGQSMMAKGKQNDLDVHCVKPGRPGLGADEECLRLVVDTMKNRIELFAIGFAPQLEKRKTPQLLEKNRIGPRACDPKRKARRPSKSSTNVSASTPLIAPGSTSLRSGAVRAPRNWFQYA